MVDVGDTSDGYHTFNELYEHRHALFIALVISHPDISWRSKKHHDGTSMEGWFICGMRLPTGDISYHLPMSKWEDLDTSGIDTLDVGVEWDGHTSADVVKRLNMCNALTC